jgi:hypothetical protein
MALLLLAGQTTAWQVNIACMSNLFLINYKNGTFSLNLLCIRWEIQMLGYQIMGVFCTFLLDYPIIQDVLKHLLALYCV